VTGFLIGREGCENDLTGSQNGKIAFLDAL